MPVTGDRWKEGTGSSKLRARFLTGAVLDTKIVEHEFGLSGGNLNQVVGKMREFDGAVFEKRDKLAPVGPDGRNVKVREWRLRPPGTWGPPTDGWEVYDPETDPLVARARATAKLTKQRRASGELGPARRPGPKPKTVETPNLPAVRKPDKASPESNGAHVHADKLAMLRANLVPNVEPPRLGESLVVTVLALNDDGTVSVGATNGERTWLARIEGESG